MNFKAISEIMHWVSLLTNIGSTILTEEDIWQEIGRIAAENAAKPEIQGYSEH